MSNVPFYVCSTSSNDFMDSDMQFLGGFGIGAIMTLGIISIPILMTSAHNNQNTKLYEKSLNTYIQCIQQSPKREVCGPVPQVKEYL